MQPRGAAGRQFQDRTDGSIVAPHSVVSDSWVKQSSVTSTAPAMFVLKKLKASTPDDQICRTPKVKCAEDLHHHHQRPDETYFGNYQIPRYSTAIESRSGTTNTTTMAYQDSPKTEDREELLASSAHSDTASMDEEKQWGPSSMGNRATRWTNSKGRTFMSALREYAWLVTIGLMAVIVVLQLAILHEVSGKSASTATTPGGDYTGKGPTCKSAVASPLLEDFFSLYFFFLFQK